ncbi:hypothetical protein CPB83DRAFT_99056 [Crepidotus variabilis]|uniref:Uncharacterized protein n=1 Tax=Crepidotus variabilis TaxID=179855 RepID=A0A9P6JSH1_9AGAR|nr:hypothetical protein CPB83DRAFT_99056 [Crepidotus variabilis]
MKQAVQQQLHGPIISPATSPALTSFPKVSRSQTLDFLNGQLLNVGKEILRRTGSNNSNSRHLQVKPFVQHIPIISFHKPPEKRHRTLLKRVLSLLEDLEENGTAIDEHAYALNSLGDIFCSLAMFQEASTVYIWAIDLYRILAQFQPEDFKPYLAEALCSLVWPLAETEASTAAAIEESIEILRSMSGPNSPPDVRCQFALQLATKHRFPATPSVEEGVLQDFDDAINILESILQEDPKFLELFGSLDNNLKLSNHLDSILSKRGQNKTQPLAIASSPLTSDLELVGYEAFLLRYSIILEGAGDAYFKLDGRSMYNAENSLLKALIVDSYLASTYPATDMSVLLARRLTYLLREGIPKERQLGYIEVSEEIFRDASKYDSKIYTNDMFVVLSGKAVLLRDLDRREEAHGTWSEIAELDVSLIKDQHELGFALELASNNLRHLGRLEEAISLRLRALKIYRTHSVDDSPREAFASCNLAYDYRLASQYQDSLQTIELAAVQFLALARWSPSQHADGLAWSLSTWRDCLVLSWSNHIPVDINLIKTLFEHYNFLIRHNIEFLNNYLETITSLISGLPDSDIAIELNLEVIGCLQNLAPEYPEEVNPKLQERLVQHGLLVNNVVYMSDNDNIDIPRADTPPLPW